MLTGVLLTAVAGWCLWWLAMRRLHWRRLGLPELPSLPLAGNLLPVLLGRRALFEVQGELYSRAKGLPYVGVFNLTTPVLILRDPGLLQAVLRDESRNFEDHGLFADPSDPLSMNLIYLNGREWKWVRSKLRPSFSTIGIRNFYPEVQKCVDEFLEDINIQGKINLKPKMEDFTCDVFAKAVFSVDSNEGLVEAGHSVYKLSGLSSLRVLLRIFFPKISVALGVKIVPQHVEDFFRNALSRSVRKPGSFLDTLLKLHEDEPDFNENLVLGQFFIFILAGFETTSTALTFCLYLLSKHPEIQEKARIEITEATRKHGISLESQKEMTYLDCVIKEALRLYSPVTSIIRVAERAYRLPCGAVLPAGSQLLIPYFYIHRDPDLYARATEFVPQRWQTDSPVFFNPFGLGPRNCLGMKFALLEMKTFLSNILLKYRLRLDPTTIEPLEFDAGSLFVVPKNPLLITVESV